MQKNIITLLFLITMINAYAQNTNTTVIINKTPTNNSITQSVTTTTTSKTSKIDDDIVSAIYSKYAKESALIGTSLIVSSKDGIVTISGTVTAQSQADQAVIAAKTINGVKDVRSNINVTTNPKITSPAAPLY